MESISFYLGLKVERNCQKRIIKLSQLLYIQMIFTKYHLDKANSINTPIKEIILRPNLSTKVTKTKKKRYQEMTSLLIFSMVKIWSNITFIIAVIAWFTKNLSHIYIKVVKTIFCYLKWLINCDIIYSGKKNLFSKDYSRFNWANDRKSQKLTSSFIFIVNRGLVS